MWRRLHRPSSTAGLACAPAALLLTAGLGLVAPAAPAGAQGPQVVQRVPCEREPGAACHELSIDIRFPGGRRAEVSLFFERAFNLTPNSFRVEAFEVPLNDASVQQRLPAGVFVNPRFPLLFTIEPNPAAATPVRFRGAWRMELETEALEFDGETPTARLFHAEDDDDQFSDFTQSVGFGSYRVRGNGGTFSQFLLVTDLRPPARIVTTGFARLELDIAAATAAGELAPALAALLRADLQGARDALAHGQRLEAVRFLDAFIQRVLDASGTDVSDVWDRSTPTPRVSRAGVLRGDAEALRLQVELATRPRSQARASIVKQLVTAAGRRVDVILEFPNEVGDTTDAFEITAVDINHRDPAYLSRLPRNVTIPSAFPVLVKITPRPGTRPAFRGAFSVELRTRDLELVNNSPLRLFKAADAQGDFADITESLAIGSYRVRGNGGTFSEFLIVNDKRSTQQVILDKLDALEEQLTALAPQISSPAVLDELQDLLATARSFAARKKQTQAIDALEELIAVVADNSGEAIPDLFVQGSRSSAAGLLTAGAKSAQLSLTLQKTGRKSYDP
jgi:DNA-binding GntR family transcriptional regulator